MSISRRNVLLGLGGIMASAAAFRAPAAIGNPVSLAVRNIVDGIERARDNTPSDKILFAPMGENHASAAQKLVLQSVLQELKDRGHTMAFGFEEQYDLLTDLTAEGHTAPLPELAYRLGDPDGQRTLRSLNGAARLYDYADQSTKSLFNFCEQHRISTGFNDLSKIVFEGSLVMDPSDGLANDLAMALELEMGGLLDVRDPVAMALRNAAIVYNASEHAILSSAEIYIQHCGYAHLFGNGGNLPFEQSLSELFQIGGNGVFAVDLQGRFGMPEEARGLIGQGRGLSIGYLPDDIYDYSVLDRKTDAVANLQQQERAYLESAVRNTKYVVYDQEPGGGVERSEKVPELAP